MTARYPWQAMRLARLYGWTPEQLGRLPIEVYDLLVSLPEPPTPRLSRKRRVWNSLTRPSASLADLTTIAALIFALNALYIDVHLPWWALFLIVTGAWSAGICGASFIRSFRSAARLSRRRP